MPWTINEFRKYAQDDQEIDFWLFHVGVNLTPGTPELGGSVGFNVDLEIRKTDDVAYRLDLIADNLSGLIQKDQVSAVYAAIRKCTAEIRAIGQSNNTEPPSTP